MTLLLDCATIQLPSVARKHECFGWDGVRDKPDTSLGQTGPVPGIEGHPPRDKMAVFCSGNCPVCLVCPSDLRRVGFVPLSQICCKGITLNDQFVLRLSVVLLPSEDRPGLASGLTCWPSRRSQEPEVLCCAAHALAARL